MKNQKPKTKKFIKKLEKCCEKNQTRVFVALNLTVMY